MNRYANARRRRVSATIWRRRITALLVCAAAVTIGLIVTTGSSAPASSARTAAVLTRTGSEKLARCADPSSSGALHVSGNEILDGKNERFTSYGITIYGGLSDGGTPSVWKAGEGSAVAQIKAAEFWHANTIRLQVNEQNLFDHGNPHDGIDRQFAKAMCSEVQRIRRQGMQVVISDQTEWPDWTESNPTQRTVKFWQAVGPAFANEPGISFDLYNEPRLLHPKLVSSYGSNVPKINNTWVWKIWKNGGKAAGQTFVGMQALVNDVRRMGVRNPIWLEGPYYDDTLGSASDYTIKGKNIIWELHHPPLTGAKYWDKFFGYLTKTYPMVDGEWSQYASNRPECRAPSYTMVPKYLKYLASHHIGMTAWSLQPGVMLADPDHLNPTNTTISRDSTNPKDLETPSRLTKPYECTNSQLGNGAGELLLKYFKKYSKTS